MKIFIRLCLMSMIILISSILYVKAQVPEAINYQAVARDASGDALQNKTISVKFTIHSGSSTGPVQYAETQTVQTNQFGIYAAKIGRGTPIGTPAFSSIPWSSGNQWLEVAIDIS